MWTRRTAWSPGVNPVVAIHNHLCLFLESLSIWHGSVCVAHRRLSPDCLKHHTRGQIGTFIGSMGSVTSKKFISVRPGSPGFSRRSHCSWLVQIGEGVVALGESVLDALVSTEVIPAMTVLGIPVLLAPCLVKDGKSAVVLLSDSVDKLQTKWDAVVVNHLGWPAWSLTLVLENYHVPVPVSDIPEAVDGVILQVSTSRCVAFVIDIVPSSTAHRCNLVAKRTSVTVTEEKDVLIFLVQLLLAGVGESNGPLLARSLIRIIFHGWTFLTAVTESVRVP